MTNAKYGCLSLLMAAGLAALPSQAAAQEKPPARSIVNRLMRELGPISAAAPAFPLAVAAIAPLRAKAEARGSGEFSPLWAGQNTSGCKEIPAAQLTRELAQGLAAPR